MGFSAIYSHVEYLLPIFLHKISGSFMVLVVFTVNATLMISYQLFWKRYAHNLNFYVLFSFQALFCLLMAMAINDTLSLTIKYILVLIGIIAFTIAEVGMVNRIDYLITKINANSLGTSFGWLSLFSAGSVAIANYINSVIVEQFGFQIMGI